MVKPVTGKAVPAKERVKKSMAKLKASGGRVRVIRFTAQMEETLLLLKEKWNMSRSSQVLQELLARVEVRDLKRDQYQKFRALKKKLGVK